MRKPEKSEETLAPARNFTLTNEDRVRALAGPPAYVRRKRAIEDLEEAIVALLVEQRTLTDAAQIAKATRACETMLARMNDLITRHNRYYPSEANLPLHPRTGEWLERGAPWRPLPLATIESLRARIPT